MVICLSWFSFSLENFYAEKLSIFGGRNLVALAVSDQYVQLKCFEP